MQDSKEAPEQLSQYGGQGTQTSAEVKDSSLKYPDLHLQLGLTGALSFNSEFSGQ